MQWAQEIEALFIYLNIFCNWIQREQLLPYLLHLYLGFTCIQLLQRPAISLNIDQKHAFSFRRLVAAGSVDSRTLYCELNDKKGLSVTATLGSRAATWLVVTGLMKICFQIFYPRAVFMFKYSVGRSWLDAGRQNSIDPSFVVLGSPISHVEPFLKWLIFLYVTT